MKKKIILLKKALIGLFIVHFPLLESIGQSAEIPGLIPYRKGDKMGFCDQNKNIVIQCIFDDAFPFSEGLARVKRDSLWGFIDESGKMVIACKFNFAFDFREGFAVVKKREKFGFIDKDGRQITPLKYDFAWSFSSGLAGVGYEDFRWGFVNTAGKEVIRPKKYYHLWDFMDGCELVDINGEWGYYCHENGDLITDYGLNPWSFFGDYAVVTTEDLDYSYVIDKKGKRLSVNQVKRIVQDKGREFDNDFLSFDSQCLSSFIAVLNIKTPATDSLPEQYYFPIDNNKFLIRVRTPEGYPAYKDINGTEYWEE